MDKYDQLIDQLKRAKNTKNAEEIDRTIEVLNTFKTFLLQKFEAQCSKFQHHKFEKQYYNNHRISVTYTALELPQPFYPDGSPVKVLFIRNIRQKLNRERLTEFLDGHSVTQFSLSNIKFSRNKSTTARIHYADLAVSCYIQTLSCLKKLEWSYMDQNGKKHSASPVVHSDSTTPLVLRNFRFFTLSDRLLNCFSIVIFVFTPLKSSFSHLEVVSPSWVYSLTICFTALVTMYIS